MKEIKAYIHRNRVAEVISALNHPNITEDMAGNACWPVKQMR